MGIGGTLEYLSGLLSNGHKHRKRKQMQTVELKVRMDCEGCELKVKKALSSMKGVKKVEINRKHHKVSVIGYVEPTKVLQRAQSTGKKAELWPYVPFNLVTHPYIAGAYDKRAPSGYVRNVEAFAVPTHTQGFRQQQQQQQQEEDHLANLFSDDNPHACSIM